MCVSKAASQVFHIKLSFNRLSIRLCALEYFHFNHCETKRKKVHIVVDISVIYYLIGMYFESQQNIFKIEDSLIVASSIIYTNLEQDLFFNIYVHTDVGISILTKK